MPEKPVFMGFYVFSGLVPPSCQHEKHTQPPLDFALFHNLAERFMGGVQNLGGGVHFLLREVQMKKEVKPYSSTTISAPFLNLNTILTSWKTVAFSSSPTHSLSFHSSRTRGCFLNGLMNTRSSRSRSHVRPLAAV